MIFSFLKRSNKVQDEASQGMTPDSKLSPMVWLGSAIFACAATSLLLTLATAVGKGVNLFLTKATGSAATLGNIMPIVFLFFIIFFVRQIRFWLREAKRDLDQSQALPLMQLGTALSGGVKILVGRLLRRAELENLGREELKSLVTTKSQSATNTDPTA
jgi:hypothetical protein